MAQGAKPPQHGADQRAGERAVALLQRRELGGRVDELVERAAAAEHAVEHIGGDTARGQPRCIVIAAGTSPRLSRGLHRENNPYSTRSCPGRGTARNGAPPIRDRPRIPSSRNGPGLAAHHFVLRCARERLKLAQ